MFGIDSAELLIIAVVALVVIGPKDLPRVMRTIGKWVGRRAAWPRHFRSGLDTMMREAELEEMEKKWKARQRADHARASAAARPSSDWAEPVPALEPSAEAEPPRPPPPAAPNAAEPKPPPRKRAAPPLPAGPPRRPRATRP